jgi:hypothetical protein
MNTCQRLPLAGPYQQNPMNNMNQTFDCINPVLNPQAPPILNSNTSPVSVPVSAPAFHSLVNNVYCGNKHLHRNIWTSIIMWVRIRR